MAGGQVASRKPPSLSLEDDPLLNAVGNAPEGPPLTDEERAQVEESERFFESGGRGKSQDEIEQILERIRAGRANASVGR
jgi:hypothetical protein